MGASNSIIECALIGIQQTQRPKKASRWRNIFRRAHKGGGASRTQSLIQLSLRLCAALLGIGLLGYLVFEAARETFGNNCRPSAGDSLSLFF